MKEYKSTFYKLCIALFTLVFQGILMAQSTTPSIDRLSKKERQAQKKAKINTLIRQEEEGALIYQKQNIFGFKLYSNGWGAMYEKGILKTIHKTNLYSIEFGERKHTKEEKLNNLSSGGGFIFSRPLIYGKQNNFYSVQLGIGQSYLIGGKGNRNGVAVSAIYKGGISLGLLKPYYVDVVNSSGKDTSIMYMGNGSADDLLFLSQPLGSSGLFKGWSDVKVKPGIFFKGSLRFDYGRYNETISAMEAGFNLEYYTSAIPIMIDNPAKKSFMSVFIAFEFGRRK